MRLAVAFLFLLNFNAKGQIIEEALMTVDTFCKDQFFYNEDGFSGGKTGITTPLQIQSGEDDAGLTLFFRRSPENDISLIFQLGKKSECILEQARIKLFFQDGNSTIFNNKWKYNCRGEVKIDVGNLNTRDFKIGNKIISGIEVNIVGGTKHIDFSEDVSLKLNKSLNCLITAK